MDYITFVLIFFALLFDRLNIFFYLVVSAALHETGHIIACCLCGCNPKIDVSVFGLKLCRYPENIKKKTIILLSGPFVNLLLVIISKVVLQNRFNLRLYVFMAVNLVIFIFNIMPVHFLDGGQIIQLFCKNHIVRNLLDILSIAAITVATVMVSENILASMLILCVFLSYYLINKKAAV